MRIGFNVLKILFLTAIVGGALFVYDAYYRTEDEMLMNTPKKNAMITTVTLNVPTVKKEIQANEQKITLSHLPEKIIQGVPVLIVADGLSATSSVAKATFRGENIGAFLEDGKISFLIGVDLREKTGTYPFSLKTADGQNHILNLEVFARDTKTVTFGIPESLGGNTSKSQDTLANTLADEAKTLTGLKTTSFALWSKPFTNPLSLMKVVDKYGYVRQTGEYGLAHKGTDFDGVVGDKVVAMNRGIVRIVHDYRNYGKTVVIDHGLGLKTIYMHMSKTQVNVGELVERGQKIGEVGSTGYSFGPHLHLTVRVGDISIDPEVFIKYFVK